MVLEVEAIFQQGALKLPPNLPLQEGQKVLVRIQSKESAVGRLYGMLQWKGSEEDLHYLLGPENHPEAGQE